MPVVRCSGADLYYEDPGEGEPIVFLHGVMAGIRYFDPQLAGLADTHRPIALDFRGHGRSEKTERGHTVPQYARDVEAFLERLSIEEVTLVGWSMGALVAWEYVEQFGTERLRGIVDVDMEPTRFRWDDYAHGTADLSSLRDTIEAIQDDHLELIDDIVEPLLDGTPPRDRRRMMFDETARCPPLVKSAILFDCTFRDYREMLPGLDVPMLVCAGADETWRSVESVELAAELAPDTSFELFERSGHCLTVKQPERFNQVVGDFVDAIR